MDLQVLMAHVMADPVGLLERVAQQALEQLERDGALASDGTEPPDQLLASALGDRLARMVARKDAPAVPGWSATGRGGGALARYEELVERNSALAAALGACDCWGEDIDCPVCDGLGEPGWALPDERLFASYVQPAVRAARRPDGPPTGAGRNGRRRGKERGDVQHVTR